RVHSHYVWDYVCDDDVTGPARGSAGSAHCDNSVSLPWNVRAHDGLDAPHGPFDGRILSRGVQAASRRARRISGSVFGARLLLALAGSSVNASPARHPWLVAVCDTWLYSG